MKPKANQIKYKSFSFTVRPNTLGVIDAYMPLIEKLTEAEYNATKDLLDDENLSAYLFVKEGDVAEIEKDTLQQYINLEIEKKPDELKNIKKIIEKNNAKVRDLMVSVSTPAINAVVRLYNIKISRVQSDFRKDTENIKALAECLLEGDLTKIDFSKPDDDLFKLSTDMFNFFLLMRIATRLKL